MKYTLIIGDEDEPQTYAFAEYLRQQGHNVHCMLITDFPDKLSISWDPYKAHGRLHLRTLTCDFDAIKSIYWHRSEALPGYSLRKHSNWLKKETHSTLSPLFHCNSIRWVNSLQAIQYHQNKPRQLHHAVKLGATIPATFVGNNVTAAAKFLKNHDSCIFKPVQGGSTTQIVSAAHRENAHLTQALSKAPVTLQANVGHTNVRTFVIGNQLFSAELRSSSIDFRDDETTEAIVIDLPDPIRDLARRICRGFGMIWCAIDWRVDENNTFYFLEANPCPYFAHFEEMTSLPIKRELGHLLVH